MRHHHHHMGRSCGFPAAAIIFSIYFVFFTHANQNNVIKSYSCPSILDGIPDQVINMGKIFQYKIPDSAFRINKDTIIRISTASDNSSLPKWISYNQENQEILAVPTINDGYGIYLKVIIEQPNSTCGSIFDVFHIAVTSLSPNIKTDTEQTLNQAPKITDDKKKSRVCRGVDLIQTTLIFAVNLKDLWAVERSDLVKNLAHFLGVKSSVITVSTGNELFSTQDNSKSYSILASGHGNTVSIVPNATELTWQVPCSVFPEVHLFVQVLQHNVEGGRLTSEVGYNVVGWYISALVNPTKQQQGRKKRFAHRFMTPIPTPVPDLVPATKWRPTFVPDVEPSTQVRSTSISDILPSTIATSSSSSSSSSSKYWWWWPDTKEETKTESSSIEESTSDTADKMTKPFPSQSEIIEHTQTASYPPSQISPTTSSQFKPSVSTPYTKSPSTSQTETSKEYHTESPYSSESPSSSSSSSSLQTSETSIPERSHSTTDHYTRSKTDVYSTRITIPDDSSEFDGISGSGDSTYTDEDSIPVIETTVLPSTDSLPPVTLHITPSPPIRKSSIEEEVQSSTDMPPYAGSGSGSGNDDEETPVIIHPSSSSSTQASSESVFVSTPSLSSVLDSSETNIFYFEETASMSTSKRISSSIYIPSWDADLLTSSTDGAIWTTKEPISSSTEDLISSSTSTSSSSWDIWITKDPWASRDGESTRETTSSTITDHSTQMWYTKKEDSTDIWSSRETGPSTDIWYTKKESSTDLWSTQETVHSTASTTPDESKTTEESRTTEESKTTESIWQGWSYEETEHTKDLSHAPSSSYNERSSSSEKINPTLLVDYFPGSETPSSSRMDKPPYSYPSTYSDIKSTTPSEYEERPISPSTDSYVPTTSTVGSIFIEEELVTKHGEMPSKYDSDSSSRMPDESSASDYRPTVYPDDCTRIGGCTREPTLEASSTYTYEHSIPDRTSTTPESTSVTPIMPVNVPTQKRPRTTTPQTTTEQKKTTKKPRKRPTLPPVSKTTGYINKAPKVRTPIGTVYAAFGTVFKFQIPKNTFHDAEDGNTRRLTLDVSYHWESRRPPANPNSWLEFDEANQVLIGLPLEEEVRQSPMEVTINAIDKGGKLAQDVIMIHVNSTTVDLSPAFEYVMKFDVNGKKFLAERKHLRNLMKKMSSFFGDRDSSYITILDARPGSLILTWTNNSIPTDRCDNETVNEQKRKIMDNDGFKFKKYMAPRFKVLSTEFNLDGICLDNEPGIGDAETGDMAEVNPWAEAIIPIVIAVAIAIFIVVVILLVCSQKQRKRKKQKEKEHRNSFEDQDPVMFHSERSNSDRNMRSKRAVILPGDVNPNSSLNRNFTPYQASGFGDPDDVSEYDDVDGDCGQYTYSNGSANPPPPYRLPPPYYHDNSSSYV